MLDLPNIGNLCAVYDITKQSEKNLVNFITNKRLVSILYKELLKIEKDLNRNIRENIFKSQETQTV